MCNKQLYGSLMPKHFPMEKAATSVSQPVSQNPRWIFPPLVCMPAGTHPPGTRSDIQTLSLQPALTPSSLFRSELHVANVLLI